ncbi:MAG TPA: RNA polymerase sigma factor [Burkholderiaceae bacterium]|jgi:RNA polymerase sigma-70 factor (ECF subfamily)
MTVELQEASAALIASIPRLRRYALALTGDRGDADDLVQDTVERGWRKLSLWRYGTDMRAWLFGIMHNMHIDHFRRRPPPADPLDEDTPIPMVRPTQEQGLELRDLASALQRLPLEQRQVLLLVALEEMSYEEVAASLAIPIGTVMSRLSRGREKLRILLEGPAIKAHSLATPLKVIK